MVHSSSKPLTTYARRRTRRRGQDSTGSASQSSPIRALSPDRNEVSFAVMANRMNKRARLVARSSDTGDSAEHAARAEDRPSKRQKPITLSGDGDYMRDSQVPVSTQLHTPGPGFSMPSDYSMALSSAARPFSAPDQLSPPPVSKRIICRTSSRNFKENAGHAGPRYLASPFSSRPGSRASSPDKNAPRVRRGLHSKSRTLSQSGALREKVVDRNVAGNTLGPEITAVSGGSSHEAGPYAKTSASVHIRSSSIPAVKPTFDHLSADTWLVLPKALSRHPSLPAEPHKYDDMIVDHSSSFYADLPIQTSTPPRRQRSATVSVWGLMPQLDTNPPSSPVQNLQNPHYDSEVDMSDSSAPSSPTDSRSSRVCRPRRRRRTIVHLPSDSLFSSSLNFSALMSETECLPRAPASEGSRSPDQQPPVLDSDLGPAISLRKSPASSAIKGLATANHLSSSRVLTSCVTGPLREEFPGPPLSSPSSGSFAAQTSSDPENDELLDLFSVLGLDEDKKWTVCDVVDDSGVVLTDRSSAKSARVRRKRGDTIRASDYPSLPVSTVSSSFDSVSASRPPGVQRAPPKRTRSGTVTQANSSVSAKRWHEGWPTIKMRTNVEPLRADEEEEDELLLKDGDVID